ncbi:arylsulfatase [Pseudonocardia sp. EC080625-04]|uniref:arylsulfatase n=1 Tax=Pseudonocardia sp. EC080625-04 TaxID=1096868 RepID=UPI001EE6FA1A|nr:arylsulfatase [Pseudonocardia sp. EC080625-04]
MDRLAARGLTLSNHHTAPLCSPARAALLTGLNPHRAGFGWVANADPGFPGMRLELGDDVATLAESLRAGGYATFAVGKWHLVRDANLAPGRPRDSWPTRRGFDRYHGSLEGLNSYFHPNQVTVDEHALDVDEYPPGYHVTEDLTDRAVAMVSELRAHDATKPFLLYLAHVAMHGPLQAPAADVAEQEGRYAAGWDTIREARFARQLERGLFPPGTRQAPRNPEPGHDVAAWDSLTDDERRRYARYMEVYAAMVSGVDASLGRITALLESLGELDDTIIVFTSDNGATAEGGAEGTRSYLTRFVHHPVPADWEHDVDHDEALIGTEELGVHYPRGWGQVSNTPFRFYKGQTYAGGVRVPLLVSWPAGPPSGGLRHDYTYVTDLAPTLLALAGVEWLAERAGVPTVEPDGTDLGAFLRGETDVSPHREQYAEMGGHRGYYRDGWKLLARHEPGADIDAPVWALHDVRTDPAELDDLSATYPERVAELAAAWEEAAWANSVFPLLDRADLAVRRPGEARLAEPVRILAGTPVLERYRSAQLIAFRSFEAGIELGGLAAGDEGVLVAHGDAFGGYLVAVEDGQILLLHNSGGRVSNAYGPVPDGVRSVTLAVTATADLRWHLAVSADGAPVTELRDRWALTGMAPWTGISVGRDARGPVSWELRRRRGVFRFTGDLRAVTYRPGERAVPTGVVRAVTEDAATRAD